MKRLVCCLDGTWNNDANEDEFTNIVKIHRAIARAGSDGIRQVSHYVRGIASNKDQDKKFLRGAVGAEVGDRIAEAYRFLKNNYDAGDEVYIFGFSRGAFEARSLASLIQLIGIAHSASPFVFEDAWALYRNSERKRSPKELQRVRSMCTYPAKITALNVFDTVGNIGNPILDNSIIDRKLAFHDMRLHANVGVALHALSIDDIRGPFAPTLFTTGKREALPKGQHVEQVWFAGSHADVGGGWKETELSDIALLWMARRVEVLTSLRFDWQILRATTRPNALGLQHASSTGKIFKWSNKIPYLRLIHQQRRGIPIARRLLLRSWRTNWLGYGRTSINEKIHESVFARLGKVVHEQVSGVEREIVYAPCTLVRPQHYESPPRLKLQNAP